MIIVVVEEVVTDVELLSVNAVLDIELVVVTEPVVLVIGNEVEVEDGSVVIVVCDVVVSLSGLFCLLSNSTTACVTSESCLGAVSNTFLASLSTSGLIVSAEYRSSAEGSASLKAS